MQTPTTLVTLILTALVHDAARRNDARDLVLYQAALGGHPDALLTARGELSRAFIAVRRALCKELRPRSVATKGKDG